MFRPSNQLSFIRRVLYNLKKDYGTSLDIYRMIDVSTDTKTGKRTWTRQKIHVKKAVLLPSVLSRKFASDMAKMFGTREFRFGGEIDINARTIIIEANDLPQGVTIDENSYTVIEGSRYEIKTVQRLEYGYGYLLNVNETKGAVAYQELDQSVGNTLQLDQNVTGTT